MRKAVAAEFVGNQSWGWRRGRGGVVRVTCQEHSQELPGSAEEVPGCAEGQRESWKSEPLF